MLPAIFAAAAAFMTTQPCYSDDVQCRLTQLEARVAAMEQGQGRRSSRGVSMAANRACGAYGCESMARTVCENAGFRRGVAVEIDPEGGRGGLLTRVECFD